MQERRLENFCAEGSRCHTLPTLCSRKKSKKENMADGGRREKHGTGGCCDGARRISDTVMMSGSKGLEKGKTPKWVVRGNVDEFPKRRELRQRRETAYDPHRGLMWDVQGLL